MLAHKLKKEKYIPFLKFEIHTSNFESENRLTFLFTLAMIFITLTIRILTVNCQIDETIIITGVRSQ